MTSRTSFRGARTAIAIAAALLASPSWALDFEFADGWKGSWTSSLSLGTALRARNADSRLYGQGKWSLFGLTQQDLIMAMQASTRRRLIL